MDVVRKYVKNQKYMTNSIQYLVGDATYPQTNLSGKKLITHISNCNSGWGKGFVLSISKRWSKPEAAYRSLAPHTKELLGLSQIVHIDNTNIYVINMVAQNGYKNVHNPKPVDLNALRTCLKAVNSFCNANEFDSIHMPRIGCGLGGCNWNKDILPILEEELYKQNIFVYDYV